MEFWRKNGVHHPFLLPDYPFDRRKGGVKYHREFAKLGLGPAHAGAVSFIELLDVPTIGVTGKDKGRFYELPSAEHLRQLERLILEGNRKPVLINQTLVNSIRTINKKAGVMHRLAKIIRSAPTATLIYESEHVSIYNGYSFSHNNTNEYLADLGKLIRTDFLGE